MTSDFIFKNYKIDHIDLKMRPELGFVLGTAIQNQNWNFHLSIRQPYYFKETNTYVGGLNFQATMQGEDASKAIHTEVVNMSVGIAGAFTTTEQLTPEIENRLVRLQIPSLLLPYLRSTVSTITSSSGFGHLILPLMNINKWAQSQEANIKVQVVEPQPLSIKAP